MRKRLVIGMVVVITSGAMALYGCRGSNPKTQEIQADRQEYAQNAYQLGLAESLAVMLMPPEESREVQDIIHQTIEQELSLEEQEKVLDEVFGLLSEYITTDIQGLDMYQQL